MTTGANRGVALEYSGDVPRVIAKARGRLLEVMIEIARRNEIVIVRDSDLTDVLSQLDVGVSIPADLYRAVSEILAYCYRVNNAFRNKINSTVIS